MKYTNLSINKFFLACSAWMHGFINNQILVEVKNKGTVSTWLIDPKWPISTVFIFKNGWYWVLLQAWEKFATKFSGLSPNSYSHHMMQPIPHGQQIHPQDAKQRRNVLYHVDNQIPVTALTKNNSRVTMGKLLAASTTIFVPFIESVTRRPSKVN